MGAQKIDLNLCKDIEKYLSSKGYQIIDVETGTIEKPTSLDDYPKVVKKSGILIERTEQGSTLEDICKELKLQRQCEHATIKSGEIHTYQKKIIEKNKQRYCLIELVKIGYDS